MNIIPEEENLKKKDHLFKNLINSNFFKHQRLDFSFEDKFTDYENWKWIVEQYDAYLKETNHVEIVPKIIHQIWIGSRVPKKYDKWRQSWLKYNPEFEYNLWDEKKILDIGLINEKKFLESKNVGIKSDIARYELLYRFGGIYVDTDFEAIKPIDKKLLCKPFVGGQLHNHSTEIASGILICKPKLSLLKILIDSLPNYKDNMNPMEILNYSGTKYMSKIVFKNKDILKEIVICPSQYFFPWPNTMIKSKKNRYSLMTKKTLAIHHWEMAWIKKSKFEKFIRFLISIISK